MVDQTENLVNLIMPFKYQTELSQLNSMCPGATYQPQNITGFRIVRDPITTNCYIPGAVLGTQTKNCSSYALSFQTSLAKSRALYQSLVQRLKPGPTVQRYGSRIVEMGILTTDGVLEVKNGHINIHEKATTNYVPRSTTFHTP